MLAMLVVVNMCCLYILSLVIFVFFCALPATGITVLGEGSTATERTTDISLRCDVRGLQSDDELVRVTWYSIDKSHQSLTEIFSADLTNDQPAFHFSSIWAGRGTFDSATLANIRLPSRYVTRDLAGDYRCQVNSLLSSGFDDVKINVLYGPGSSIIITPGGRVEKQQGDALNLTCSAQCSPVCSYRWYKAGRQVSISGVMVMTEITLEMAGLYACQARNEAGRSIKPVDLRVRFPASILNLTVSGTEVDSTRSVLVKSNSIHEQNDTIVFTCRVKAWPEPNIEWTRSSASNVATSNTNVAMTTQDDLELKSSRYEIKSANCRDNGEYTCKTWNIIGTPSFKTAVLNMSCAPFETNHSNLCQSGKEVNIIRNLQTRLRIIVCFFGHPVPKVTLSYQNNVTTIYAGDIKCDFTMNYCDAVFDFNITSPEQYGIYKVKISNNFGHFEKRYIVTSQQPPLLPSMFIVSDISQTSACFSWKSNFNGGATQTFALKIYASNKHQKSDEVFQSKQFTEEEDNTRTSSTKNDSGYFKCVRNLHPATQLEAVLTVSNMFGVSDSSRNVTFTTDTSINNTISIPSWLSIVQVSTVPQINGKTSLPTDMDSFYLSREIGEIILQTQTIERPQTTVKDILDFHNPEDRNDNKETELSPSDNIFRNDFSQLFNSHFVLSKVKNDSHLVTRNRSKAHSSNYSFNLQRFFSNYARTNDQGHRDSSMSDSNTRSILNKDITTSETPLTTTPHHETMSTVISLSPVMISTVIGIASIVGILIAFGCIAFFRRRQRRKYCNPRCRQKHNGKIRKNTIAVIGSSPCSPTTTNRALPQRAPSITCIYNENVTFSSPLAVKRPRLSTPDEKSFRKKDIIRTDTSVSSDGRSSEHLTTDQCDLPIITLENTRPSCPSYIELYQGVDEQTDRLSGPNSDLEQHHLRLPNQRFSYSSPHQTFVKNVSDEELDISTSYLDLYEALNSRSRSRSPSNIYDPFLFDDTFISNSVDAGECVQNIQLCKKESMKIEGNADNQNISAHTSILGVGNKETTTAYKAGQASTACVQLRPKKILPSLKSRSLPSLKSRSLPKLKSRSNCANYLPKTIGTTTEASYELVDVCSRKHLSSGVYLPMVSETRYDCVITENCQYANSELPENENPIFLTSSIPRMFQSSEDSFTHLPNATARFRSFAESSEENKYDSSIRMESTVCDHQSQLTVCSESNNTPHYVDTYEFPPIRSPIASNLEHTHDHLLQCSSCVKARYDNLTFKDSTPVINNTSGCKTSVDIYDINGYILGDNIPMATRHSAGTISTGSCSIYSNETEIRRSTKSSSESDCGVTCPRQFSFDSDSTEERFGVFQAEVDVSQESRRSSIDAYTNVKDRRDSGVFFNYRHSNDRYKHILVCSQDPKEKNCCSSAVISVQQSETENDVYEEPIQPDHIYAEVTQ